MKLVFRSSRRNKMHLKLKESLSGNLKTPVVSYVTQTKTNHSCTYTRKGPFFLDTMCSYGDSHRSIYE